MTMILIGITGKAGSGKDTVALYLKDKMNLKGYSMADPIKEMLWEGLGVDCCNRETKEKPHPMFGVSPRKMAQTLGTDWMRYLITEDGWLALAKEELEHQAIACRHKGMVISDIRFQNEANWIRENGVLIHVERPDVDEVEKHVSEDGIAYISGDYLLVNDGSVKKLNQQIDVIMKLIKSNKV